MESELGIESTRTTASRVIMDGSWVASVQSLAERRLLVADARLADWIKRVAEDLEVEDTLHLGISEAEKTLSTVGRVYQWLGEKDATRDTLVVALGGGVLTDLTGYAAATYLRGLTWACVPTTLLAQVDASIGGKVGVNTDWGKNLVGAFHLPAVVAVDTRFLTTLPPREWRAGLGEVIKSALIRGGWLYDALNGLQLPSPGTVAEWTNIVAETAAMKVNIVNQDLFETGPRMYLNLGHTVGHALENLLGYGVLTHGEAVGLGTLAALRLSEETLGLSPRVRETVLGWMRAWELPTEMPKVDFERLWQQLHRDKKARTRGLTWVLLADVGEPRLLTNLERDRVQAVIEELSGA